MGIDVACFNYILKNKEKVKGNTLQLGRQGLHFAGFMAGQAKENVSVELFKHYCPTIPFANLVEGCDGHTEKFFTVLGAETVDSIDYSNYERANIIHDLNKPIPAELYNKYDFIFDGGTIEHIFDIKMCIDNVKKMLKVGGYFCSITVCNNFVGHGFYQFSPEFFRSAFSEENGYKVHDIELAELIDQHPYFQCYSIPAPSQGSRQAFRTNPTEHYICSIVEKIKDNDDNNEIQQSDYLKIWGKT